MKVAPKGRITRRVMRKWNMELPQWIIVWLGIIGLSVVSLTPFTHATAPTLTITLGTFSPYYSPKIAKTPTGIPIAWRNPTATVHSITHDGCQNGDSCAFDSGALGPNRSFTISHLAPGYYPYHCTFHPIMKGVLIVLDSESSDEI